MTAPAYSVVVPTLGRPSLAALLAALEAGAGPLPAAVVVVDDRAAATPLTAQGLAVEAGPRLGPRLSVVLGPGRGPAAARNVGWRATATPWVAFLDDDVVPAPDWARRLAADLAGLGERVGGCQGRVEVPLPSHRRPTDWERSTAGLAGARWVTADMAYRRAALDRVGGFDERFRRAYREDCDLALRLLRAGWTLAVGSRQVAHPPRPAGRWASVQAQAGNADDVLMRRLHGRRWRARAGAPAGRLRRHAAITGAGLAGLTGLAAVAAGSRRPAARWLAGAGAAGWFAGTAELAYVRVRAGPRTVGEVATMLATSVAIPPAATRHWLRGMLAHRHPSPWPPPPLAVLFDRDSTLIRDLPGGVDPGLVEPMPGALAALTLLRERGVPVGVVTNQPVLSAGLATPADVRRVHARVEELLGPFHTWQVCGHGEGAGCGCRKPAPGLVHAAAGALGVPVERCVLIGDIGADLAAARAAGARAVLVPTEATRAEEVAEARRQPGCAVAGDLVEAVWLALATAEPPAAAAVADRPAARAGLNPGAAYRDRAGSS